MLAGTWEALISGRADLAIGVGMHSPPPGVAVEPLGELSFVFAVAPQHPLAAAAEPISDVELLRFRAVAVADSAQHMSPLTLNLLPGQDVLTVTSMAAKIEALRRGLGCGYVPEPMVRDDKIFSRTAALQQRLWFQLWLMKIIPPHWYQALACLILHHTTFGHILLWYRSWYSDCYCV